MAHKRRTVETDVFGLKVNDSGILSKRKGNNNERNAAKSLQEWCGYSFVRTPASGGLRWQDSTNVAADIICAEPGVEWNWVVETKHLKSIHTDTTLRENSIIFTIWNQVHSDSLRVLKLPMALLRYNGMPSGEYILVLSHKEGGWIMSLQVPVLFRGNNSMYNLLGFKFSEVKRLMPFATFEKLTKNLRSKSKLII
jgi:hypothetical protein